MDVYEAVVTRRSVRALRHEPVPRKVLARMLTTATRSPSSGNLQPWQALAGDPGDDREYPNPDLVPPHSDRFFAATQRNAALGIDRDDPARPAKVAALNTSAFGAPVVLSYHLDQTIGPGQWGDAGMSLQTRTRRGSAGGPATAPFSRSRSASSRPASSRPASSRPASSRPDSRDRRRRN